MRVSISSGSFTGSWNSISPLESRMDLCVAVRTIWMWPERSRVHRCQLGNSGSAGWPARHRRRARSPSGIPAPYRSGRTIAACRRDGSADVGPPRARHIETAPFQQRRHDMDLADAGILPATLRDAPATMRSEAPAPCCPRYFRPHTSGDARPRNHPDRPGRESV